MARRITKIEKKQHHLVLESWHTIHSEAKALIRYEAFDPEVVPELEKTIEELDDFFATFGEYLYITGVCSRIATVGWVLWPRLIDLTARDNFAVLLKPLIPRFEHYYWTLTHTSVDQRRAADQLQAFWEQLKTSYALLTKPEHDIGLFLGQLSYAIGVMSGLVDLASTNANEVIPGFEHFQADVVNLGDILAVMNRFVILHNFVQHIESDLAVDLHFFVGHLGKTLPVDVRTANENTAALKAVKVAFELEKANLDKR
jgi:hypothetical protein